MDGNWTVKVKGAVEAPYTLTEKTAAAMDDGSVRPGERVPGIGGKGIELAAVLNRARLSMETTHVVFQAADDFRAQIPLRELEGAFLLYRCPGSSPAGNPVRLYVPDGSSQCLNVKSVIAVEAVTRTGNEAQRPSSYGFRQTVSPEELRSGGKGSSV